MARLAFFMVLPMRDVVYLEEGAPDRQASRRSHDNLVAEA